MLHRHFSCVHLVSVIEVLYIYLQRSSEHTDTDLKKCHGVLYTRNICHGHEFVFLLYIWSSQLPCLVWKKNVFHPTHPPPKEYYVFC